MTVSIEYNIYNTCIITGNGAGNGCIIWWVGQVCLEFFIDCGSDQWRVGWMLFNIGPVQDSRLQWPWLLPSDHRNQTGSPLDSCQWLCEILPQGVSVFIRVRLTDGQLENIMPFSRGYRPHVQGRKNRERCWERFRAELPCDWQATEFSVSFNQFQFGLSKQMN